MEIKQSIPPILRPERVKPVSFTDLVGHFQLGNSSGDAQLTGVSMNTADIRLGDLFVALPGLKTHGANYIAKAKELGAVAFLTDSAGREIVGETDYFYTNNGSQFEYNKNGGWYFTVNGSESTLEMIQQHYLLDREANGVGKVHESLENIITLQNFCELKKVTLVQQFFMDFVHRDIERYKDHQIINYLYKQLATDKLIRNGMFEYIHEQLNIPRENAMSITHMERTELSKEKDYFHPDGFHPGEYGAKLYCENVLFPALKDKL